MKKSKSFILFNLPFFVFFLMIFITCKHKIEAPDSPHLCYSNDIAPILSTNCMMAGCHGNSGVGDINISNYQGVMNLVKPGDPQASDLYNVLSSTWGTMMPPKPNGPLAEAQRSTIYFWILQGASNDCSLNTSHTTPVPVVDSICFTNDVLPIFVSHCTMSGCHDLSTHAGDYVFTNYQYIMQGIVPGNANASKVHDVITGGGDDLMPPAPYSPLTQAQKDTISKWINQGAKNTFCSGRCDTTQFTYSQIISKIIQSSCTGCHSGTNPAFGLTLQSYSDVQTISANGLLLSVINNTNNKPLMPPGSPLLQCKKTQIKKWLDAGILNN